jgi:hypothetical protein
MYLNQEEPIAPEEGTKAYNPPDLHTTLMHINNEIYHLYNSQNPSPTVTEAANESPTRSEDQP